MAAAAAQVNANDVNLNSLYGRVSAFGDLDGDLSTDFFIIDNTWQHVDVYLAVADQRRTPTSASRHASAVRRGPRLRGNAIVAVLPSDYDRDGLLDVALVQENTDNAALFDVIIWWRAHGATSTNAGFAAHAATVLTGARAHPFLADVDGGSSR